MELARSVVVILLDNLFDNLLTIVQWSYKIPFAVQWAWPVPLIAILSFAPESPWWLVRKGRLEEAEQVIKRLESRKLGREPSGVVAMMQRTIEIENHLTKGASLAACFKGVDLKRTMYDFCR
jgi:SP family general alpha glucoside:H+ symporter-like MFS transporter